MSFRWREKVYELMLQLKCEELAHRDEIRAAKQMVRQKALYAA